MSKFKVIGHFKLSAKALKREAKAFEKFTGVPAEKIRVVVLRLADDTKWHHFFYYNHDTRVVDPYPEYRRLDSFFAKDDERSSVFINRADIDKTIDQFRRAGLTQADLLEVFLVKE